MFIYFTGIYRILRLLGSGQRRPLRPFRPNPARTQQQNHLDRTRRQCDLRCGSRRSNHPRRTPRICCSFRSSCRLCFPRWSSCRLCFTRRSNRYLCRSRSSVGSRRPISLRRSHCRRSRNAHFQIRNSHRSRISSSIFGTCCSSSLRRRLRCSFGLRCSFSCCGPSWNSSSWSR